MEEETNTISISIKSIEETVAKKIPELLKEQLESSYDNPIKQAIEEEMKSVDGIVKITVKRLLKKVMEDKELEVELLEVLKNSLIKRVLQS